MMVAPIADDGGVDATTVLIPVAGRYVNNPPSLCPRKDADQMCLSLKAI
jgi:hypothetical protein